MRERGPLCAKYKSEVGICAHTCVSAQPVWGEPFSCEAYGTRSGPNSAPRPLPLWPPNVFPLGTENDLYCMLFASTLRKPRAPLVHTPYHTIPSLIHHRRWQVVADGEQKFLGELFEGHGDVTRISAASESDKKSE